MVPNHGMLQKLVYWIKEREQMRIRKEAGGKWPFSEDPVMANNRYTNVRREDDKVTKWLADNWRYPREDLTKWMCLARMVNYIPTLEEIKNRVSEWDAPLIQYTINVRIRGGEKTWSSAYMITTCGKKMDKTDYVVNWVSDKAPEVSDYTTCGEAFKKLVTVDGLGSFLAGQIIADLKNTKTSGLASARDFNTFSVPGPGSLRGLSALYGMTITPQLYLNAIWTAWDYVEPLLPPELQDLSMQDLQNCFCEFSKFVRGYGRNKYGHQGK